MPAAARFAAAQSVPFVLGVGDLTWEVNGGDHTVPSARSPPYMYTEGRE